jgi:uncharacterized membrane protein HdeD (DUF308 family)
MLSTDRRRWVLFGLGLVIFLAATFALLRLSFQPEDPSGYYNKPAFILPAITGFFGALLTLLGILELVRSRKERRDKNRLVVRS